MATGASPRALSRRAAAPPSSSRTCRFGAAFLLPRGSGTGWGGCASPAGSGGNSGVYRYEVRAPPAPLMHRREPAEADNAHQGCPTRSRALEILSDRWTSLIRRDLLTHKKHRFQDRESARRGISPSSVSARHERPKAHGVVPRRLYVKHPPRAEYLLTSKGRELWPAMRVLWPCLQAMDLFARQPRSVTPLVCASRAGAERYVEHHFGDTCGIRPQQVEGQNVGLCPCASAQFAMASASERLEGWPSASAI
ncbi:hypothetical protein BVG81_003355 [Haliangium sp. UPWRP_2]|nr:hypothetical protein BVG81_003355 [Haliangium sp. UPWRP_2]